MFHMSYMHLAYLLYFVLINFHLVLCRYLIYLVIFYINTVHSLLAGSDFFLTLYMRITTFGCEFYELRYRSDDAGFSFWSFFWCYVRLVVFTVASITSLL